MTDKELQKLRRPELLSLLLNLKQENETLRAELEKGKEQLSGRELLLENRMNAVFYDDAGHGLNHELSEEINRKIISVFLEEGK